MPCLGFGRNGCVEDSSRVVLCLEILRAMSPCADSFSLSYCCDAREEAVGVCKVCVCVCIYGGRESVVLYSTASLWVALVDIVKAVRI